MPRRSNHDQFDYISTASSNSAGPVAPYLPPGLLLACSCDTNYTLGGPERHHGVPNHRPDRPNLCTMMATRLYAGRFPLCECCCFYHETGHLLRNTYVIANAAQFRAAGPGVGRLTREDCLSGLDLGQAVEPHPFGQTVPTSQSLPPEPNAETFHEYFLRRGYVTGVDPATPASDVAHFQDAIRYASGVLPLTAESIRPFMLRHGVDGQWIDEQMNVRTEEQVRAARQDAQEHPWTNAFLAPPDPDGPRY